MPAVRRRRRIWKRLPPTRPCPTTNVSEIDGKINDIGKLEAHVHYEFRGDEELLLRSVFRRVPEANWQRVAENINSGLGGDVTQSESQRSGGDPRALHPVLRCFQARTSSTGRRRRREIALPLVQFSLPEVDDDDTDRRRRAC